MDTSAPAVRTRGLTERLSRLVAVNALDLDVQPGQVFAFLGLNGAGKTTTIRLSLDWLDRHLGQAR